jgi:thiamine pyrophosphokinase
MRVMAEREVDALALGELGGRFDHLFERTERACEFQLRKAGS